MRVLITGASRGIGAAVARQFAKNHGSEAIIAVMGRSLARTPHPDLRGTLMDTVRDVESNGACGIPFEVDLTCVDEVMSGLKAALSAMGGLDVLINNASAVYLSRETPAKRIDLMHDVNTRACLLANQTCRDALAQSSVGSIVTVSPPLRFGMLEWLSSHPAYTVSKYSMTLAGLAAASNAVRSNCIWPRYTVATCATRRLETETKGRIPAFSKGRPPDDVAVAVHALALSTEWNARALYDDDVVCLPKTDAPLDLFATPSVAALRTG